MTAADNGECIIQTKDLRRILDAVFENIENSLGIKEICLKEDMYWAVPYDKKYDVPNEPGELMLGQLFDDWDLLRHVREDESLATPMNLMHLAPILEYMATRVQWFDASRGDAVRA